MAALPTVEGQLVSLGDLLETAGADDSIRGYIKARRINTTPTLALIAKDVEQFTTQVIHPFINGTRIDGTDFKVEDGQDGVGDHDSPVCGGLAAVGGGFPGPDIAAGGGASERGPGNHHDDDGIHP